MFDVKERIRAIREIDGILANAYQYVLHWDAPSTRIAYLEQIRNSAGLSDAHGRLLYGVYQLWWIDPDKDAKLQAGLARFVRETGSRADRGSLLG